MGTSQWDSKCDDIEYSADGGTVTARGTTRNTNQWKEGAQDNWVNMGGSDTLADQAFTVSATCN